MRVGYARVSTQDQKLDLQRQALQAAGCDLIFEDHISGTRAKRPGLDKVLAKLAPGVVVVVWRLDRLGRSLSHLVEVLKVIESKGAGFVSLNEAIDTTSASGRLVFHMMAALAEFERSLIVERTQAGLAAAKARGAKLGRRRKLTPKQVAHGRALLDAGETRWQDGPLTLAARHGALCYLDEIVEARADTAVVIHPLTDTRRMLPLERRNELVRAHPDFALVVSYNPGAGSGFMKASTRQRFCGLEFDYPDAENEAEILMRESGVEIELASALVALGRRSRRLAGHGLDEGASTRMLVRAAALVRAGASPAAACRMALVAPLTDDAGLRDALLAAVEASF